MFLKTIRRSIMAATVAASLAAPSIPSLVAAEEVGYWPDDEDDQQLKELDNEVLRLQKARFQAIFAEKKDEEEIERINKDFDKAQKARGKLLLKTGRY